MVQQHGLDPLLFGEADALVQDAVVQPPQLPARRVDQQDIVLDAWHCPRGYPCGVDVHLVGAALLVRLPRRSPTWPRLSNRSLIMVLLPWPVMPKKNTGNLETKSLASFVASATVTFNLCACPRTPHGCPRR
eukprot:SRR837773.23056.p1 GENE.SRR837773.23056~~SRR837773.23056.p1  ORF type:complete len:132 (+),score=9.99 SRR837773.23056:36-431(+)